VEGHDRHDAGARQPARDARPELLGRLAAEGEDKRLVGRETALDPVDDELDERRGLASARPGEHQQRTGRTVGAVLEHRALAGVELRRCCGRSGTLEEVLDGHAPISPDAPDTRAAVAGRNLSA
jgi:hypothetical protein